MLQEKESNENTHWKFARLFKDEQLSPFLYALSEKMEQGNVCLDLNQLESNEKTESESLFSKIDIDYLKNHPLVGKDTDNEIKPFILRNNLFYTQRLFTYEQRFVDSILKLLKLELAAEIQQKLLNQPELLDFTNLLFPNPQNEQKTNWQFIACLTAFLHPFSIITGGPGTGKTTVISKLLSLLIKERQLRNEPDLIIELAAPTGKARARMEESLKGIRDNFEEQGIEVEVDILSQIEAIQPQTIHRLLGYQYDNIEFKHNENNFLEADIVVIDECSMIDIALFSKLLKSINPEKTKLILLGDRNQLASVDAGSLFGDLCLSLPNLNEFDDKQIQFFKSVNASMTQLEPNTNHHNFPLFGHIVELQVSYRFSDDKGIGKFSKAVLAGDWEQVAKFQKQEGVIELFNETENEVKEKSYDSWINHFMSEIPKSYALEPNITEALKQINSYKVLCATRKGKQGIVHFNQILKTEITSKEKNKWSEIYENQLIMVTQNQPDLKLDNGDIGIVRYNEKQELMAYFPEGDNTKAVLAAAIEQHEDAYSITIHKSQGSEFDHVLIIIPDTENEQFLTRELLYTAVTRAKKSAIILGSKEMMEKMVNNKVARVSGIIESLNAKH